MDENFRAALRNAFLTCTIDSRRLHFLSRHFSAEEELPEGSYEGNGTKRPTNAISRVDDVPGSLQRYARFSAARYHKPYSIQVFLANEDWKYFAASLVRLSSYSS